MKGLNHFGTRRRRVVKIREFQDGNPGLDAPFETFRRENLKGAEYLIAGSIADGPSKEKRPEQDR